MDCKEVAFLGFQASSSWLNDEAFSNRDLMSRTAETSHAFRWPLKDDAATNISAIVNTEDVSHPSRSWSKADAR